MVDVLIVAIVAAAALYGTFRALVWAESDKRVSAGVAVLTLAMFGLVMAGLGAM